MRKTRQYRYRERAWQACPEKAGCHSCRADVLAGRHDALPIVCDPYRLSARGELLALLLGLKTWHIVEPHVYKRHHLAIRDERFPKLGYILQEHRCGVGPPTGEALKPLPPPTSANPP